MYTYVYILLYIYTCAKRLRPFSNTSQIPLQEHLPLEVEVEEPRRRTSTARHWQGKALAANAAGHAAKFQRRLRMHTKNKCVYLNGCVYVSIHICICIYIEGLYLIYMSLLYLYVSPAAVALGWRPVSKVAFLCMWGRSWGHREQSRDARRVQPGPSSPVTHILGSWVVNNIGII